MDIKMVLLNSIKLSGSTTDFEKTIKKLQYNFSSENQECAQMLKEAMKVACEYAEYNWICYLHEQGAKITTEEIDILLKSKELDKRSMAKEMVCLVIEKATDIDYKVGISFLHTPYYSIVIEKLIERNIDITENDNELFIEACAKGACTNIVEKLLKAGADPTARNNEALIVAVKNGNRFVIDTLIKVGVPVDANNNAAIKEAYNNSDLDMIRYLYSKGARFEDFDISAKANIFLQHFIYDVLKIEYATDMILIDHLVDAGAYIRVIDYLPIRVLFTKKLMEEPLYANIAKKVYKTMKIR